MCVNACHQALTPISLLNKILGRLAMLPSWHAYSVWDYGHNGLHHLGFITDDVGEASGWQAVSSSMTSPTHGRTRTLISFPPICASGRFSTEKRKN